MCVEKLEERHDQSIHGDVAFLILIKVVPHGRPLLFIQQVPCLFFQHDSGLVHHAAQRYLGASQAPVKHRLQKKTGDRLWPGMPRNQLLKGGQLSLC